MINVGLRNFQLALTSNRQPYCRILLIRATASAQLDGKLLQAPHICAVSWKAFQTFTADDDPDRTRKYVWKAPSFLEVVDPKYRSLRTTVERLDVSQVKGYQEGFSFASLVRGVMDEAECAELLQSVNTKGFTPALVNLGDGRQRLLPKIRDGLRMVHDSPLLTRWLSEVLRMHLPPSMDAVSSPFRQLCSGRVSFSRINERCRFLCYTPGQKFKRHSDGGEVWPREARTGAATLQELTMVTLQLYLHDVPPEHGGATSFIIEKQDSEEKMLCQPCAGSVLLFTQDLLHEGSQMEQGFKYTMRSDVFYAIAAES